MKLIYIANTTLPTKRAHGLQIMKMCQAFATQKMKTELWVPKRFTPKDLKGKNPFKYYATDKNFKIKKIFCLDLVFLNAFWGPLYFWTQSFSFAFFLFIRLIFKKNILIYSRDRVSLFFLSLFKKNTVFEVHKTNKLFFWGTVKRAGKIVVISSGLKEELVKNGVSTDKIFVAFDGVDLSDFRSLENKDFTLSKNKKLVVYTGHLYDWKGVDKLALASKFLPEDIKVVLVGGLQKDIKRFRRLIEENELMNVVLWGHQSYCEVISFLKSADCLVLTGTNNHKISAKYTSPLKMFEYMAAQKPIVASDLPSFRSVLNDKNSVLVKPDSAKALANGIKKVLENQKLAQEISKQAYSDVKQYDWRRRAKDILEFVND